MTRATSATKTSVPRWGKMLAWVLGVLFALMSLFGFYIAATWMLYTHSAQARVVDYRGPFGPGAGDGGFTYDLYLQVLDARGEETTTKIYNYLPPVLQTAQEAEASFPRGEIIDIYLNPKMSKDVLMQSPREHIILTLGASLFGLLLSLFFFRFGPRMPWKYPGIPVY